MTTGTTLTLALSLALALTLTLTLTLSLTLTLGAVARAAGGARQRPADRRRLLRAVVRELQGVGARHVPAGAALRRQGQLRRD